MSVVYSGSSSPLHHHLAIQNLDSNGRKSDNHQSKSMHSITHDGNIPILFCFTAAQPPTSHGASRLGGASPVSVSRPLGYQDPLPSVPAQPAGGSHTQASDNRCTRIFNILRCLNMINTICTAFYLLYVTQSAGCDQVKVELGLGLPSDICLWCYGMI